MSWLPDSVTTASQESAFLTTTKESTADQVLKSTNWLGGRGHPARHYLRKRWPAAEGQCRCARLQTRGCPSSWWDAAETVGSHSSSAERPWAAASWPLGAAPAGEGDMLRHQILSSSPSSPQSTVLITAAPHLRSLHGPPLPVQRSPNLLRGSRPLFPKTLYFTALSTSRVSVSLHSTAAPPDHSCIYEISGDLIKNSDSRRLGCGLGACVSNEQPGAACSCWPKNQTLSNKPLMDGMFVPSSPRCVCWNLNPNMTASGDRTYEEVIKVKWGHQDGVLTRRERDTRALSSTV